MPDSIPMPWLGRQADMSGPARAIGTIAGGAIRAGRASRRNDTSFLSELPQGMEEASGLQDDPQFLLKRAMFNKQIVGIGIEYETKLSQLRQQTMTMAANATDEQALSRLTLDAGGDPDKLLTGLTSFVPKSPQGLQASTQLRMAASQSLSRKLTAQNNSAVLKRAQSLSPENWSTFQSFPRNEDGSYSPQAIEFLGKNAADSAKPLSPLGSLLSDRETARAAGKLDQVALYDMEIQSRAAKDGLNIQFDDKNMPIINYGPNASGIGKPTVATQTAAQRKLQKYEAATELLTTLERSLKPEHLGAQGLLGEFIFDKGLAQFDERFANKDRIDQRTALIAAREGLLREISDDNRFSNQDRDEISRALPSNGIWESYPDAIQKIRTVRGILKSRGRIYGEGINLPPPLWTLSPDEIREAYDKGELKEGQAVKLLERFEP